jgi:hypothetical protein
MKRLVVALACLALAWPLLAEKPVSHQAPSAIATITGSPLTIVVGDDTSMQVYNTNVPGTGQFFSPSSAPADAGIYVRPAGGVTYGPCCGGSAPFTLVSLSPVTGTGTSGDPFKVVIVVGIPTTSVQMTETMTYVNGSSNMDIVLSFVGNGNPVVNLDAFIGADLYLAGNDRGFSFAGPTAAGGRGADTNCGQLQYTISFLGTTPANRYSANGYAQIWSEISAGSLSNTSNPSCIDNGAALQWTGLAVGAAPVVINTAASFSGQAIPLGAVVPALSTVGLAALVLLLAVVGYVLARKSSLGA